MNVALQYIKKINTHVKTYVQLLCFFLFISLRLQCTVVLLEDKMTKRHKFTIKERKTGDKLTGVRDRVRERKREKRVLKTVWDCGIIWFHILIINRGI